MLPGFADHALDVRFRKPARRLNRDLLLLARSFVPRRDVNDAVGVDIEGDLDLRLAERCRRNPDQVELGRHPVVGAHLALALEPADAHRAPAVPAAPQYLRT